MTVLFSAGNQAVSATASDIVTGALMEIGVVSQGENPNPEDSAWGLQRLQRLIDLWNAQRELIYAVVFQNFTLIPNHAPHTIGPGGDFNLPTRPPKIVSGNFILNQGSSNPIYAPPIRMMDHDWWATLPTPQLISSIITHCYYEPSNPLGTLNFWPICNVAGPVRLEFWSAIMQALSLGTSLALPQGYYEALTLDLAVKLAPSFDQPVSPDLREQWSRAMRTIEANNNEPPRIDTDSGMPNSRRGGRPDFNFLTGLRE